MAGRLTLDQPARLLGSGAMAAHYALDVGIEVQILAPQPKKYLEKNLRVLLF
jgi:hypothetical protein